jgi:hypothetical protein
MKYEINGKLEDEIKKITGIQDLIGIKAKNVFKSLSEEELEEKISEMTLIDLQKLAVSCGVSGGGSRTVLKKKIKNEFLKFNRGSHGLSISSEKKMELVNKNERMKQEDLYNLIEKDM